MKDFIITPDIELAMENIRNSDKNLYIDGKAGTGKSYFVEYLKEECSDKNISIVAPTGIAAVNIGGETIHSFFGFKIGLQDLSGLKKKKKRVHDIVKDLDILIIDEISMVRADIFDAIDITMRANGRDKDKPFGGVKVIVIGDLEQLPPIVSSEEKEIYFMTYRGVYFTEAMAYSENIFEKIEFRNVFRQKDEKFIRALNCIREKRNLEGALQYINKRVMDPQEDHISIVPYNRQADTINMNKLDGLKEKKHIFKARILDDFPKSKYPAEEQLHIKVGARIMMIKNDPAKVFINGTMGRVLKIKKDAIKVRLDLPNGGDVDTYVEMASWDNVKYKNDNGKIKRSTSGKFIQFPIKLAWATTVHKSQGKTLDRVFLDKGRGMFVKGQAYVALSRCRTYEGLFLKTPIEKSDIILN